MPDVFQVGNTWIPELVALGRARAARRAASRRSASVDSRRLLPRHPRHQRRRRHDLGRSLVRRHATPLLSHATCSPPPAIPRRRARGTTGRRRWPRVKARGGPDALRRSCCRSPSGSRWCSSALRSGRDAPAGRRPPRRLPERPRSARALRVLRRTLPRAGSRRSAAHATVANVYQDFARGDFAFFITGPWNLGEFARRLPAALAGRLVDGAHARARRRGRPGRRSPAARAWRSCAARRGRTPHGS